MSAPGNGAGRRGGAGFGREDWDGSARRRHEFNVLERAGEPQIALRRHTSVIVTRVIFLSAVVLLPGCASASHDASQGAIATITGNLEAVGGLPPGSPRPLPGNIVATRLVHSYTAPVGSGGRYSVTVPPGPYTLTGRSPLYGGGSYECQAGDPVTVLSGATVTVNVYCQER
jgi:hypothetical protein